MAKKLIKLKVEFTVKIEENPGTYFKHFETERLYLVGHNLSASGLEKRVNESIEIFLHLKQPKLLEKDIEITEKNFVVLDGRKKRRGSGISVWAKDMLTNVVTHYNSMSDMAKVLDIPVTKIRSYMKDARGEGVDYLLINRYAMSLDGEIYTSNDEWIKLDKTPSLAEIVGALEKDSIVVLDLSVETLDSYKVYKTPAEAARATDVSANTIIDRCVNYALDLSNIEGRYAFWFEKEYIPGVTKPREKVERSYYSIRVEGVSITNKKDVVVSRTIMHAAADLDVTAAGFRRYILNRGVVYKGRTYRTLGSSCLIPKFVEPKYA